MTGLSEWKDKKIYNLKILKNQFNVNAQKRRKIISKKLRQFSIQTKINPQKFKLSNGIANGKNRLKKNHTDIVIDFYQNTKDKIVWKFKFVKRNLQFKSEK